MADAIYKNHVFACGIGVAKAVADVESHFSAVNNGVQTAPVPSVFVCPNTTSPVQNGKAIQLLLFATDGEGAIGAHAVDFLVVVEVLGFVERSGNNHGVAWLIRQFGINFEQLLLLAPFVEGAFQNALAIHKAKTHLHALGVVNNVPFGGSWWQFEFAKGKKAHFRIGNVGFVDKVQVTCGNE